MSERANQGHEDADGATTNQSEPELPAAVATVEAYETEDGVVLYDAQNPLAWLSADNAVTLEEQT